MIRSGSRRCYLHPRLSVPITNTSYSTGTVRSTSVPHFSVESSSTAKANYGTFFPLYHAAGGLHAKVSHGVVLDPKPRFIEFASLCPDASYLTSFRFCRQSGSHGACSAGKSSFVRTTVDGQPERNNAHHGRTDPAARQASAIWRPLSMVSPKGFNSLGCLLAGRTE